MDELQPCPFCGKPDPTFLGAIVVCSNPECGASVSVKTMHDTANRVRRKWNRRPATLPGWCVCRKVAELGCRGMKDNGQVCRLNPPPHEDNGSQK